MKKLATAAICAVVLTACCGCDVGFPPFAAVPNYSVFIETAGDLPQTGTPPSDENPPDSFEVPKVSGFSPINSMGFDSPWKTLRGDYAVCTLNGEKAVVDKRGNVYPCPADAENLTFGKYVFYENGLCGIKDFRGNILHEAKYDKASAIGDTVLLVDKNYNRIFVRDRLVSAAPASEKISLCDEERVIRDGKLCSLELKPIVCDGYEVLSVSGNTAITVSSDGKLGYYFFDGRASVSPRYATAEHFTGDYATVQLAFGGKYTVIDKTGKEQKSFSGRPFGFYDGYMFVSDGFDGADLFDDKFDYTGLSFERPKYRRVFGDIVIDENRGKLFSLSKSDYVLFECTDIEAAPFGFILRTETSAAIVSKSAEIITTAKTATYSEGVLSLQFSDKYYYYAVV